uniref:Uncharacterized protein n=1 Tax=Aegilops tauschii subsp. strangulata TaxID=200361 RepID=A0A453PWH5_AEGTS
MESTARLRRGRRNWVWEKCCCRCRIWGRRRKGSVKQRLLWELLFDAFYVKFWICCLTMRAANQST